MINPDQWAGDIVQVITALTALIAAIGSVAGVVLSVKTNTKVDNNAKKLEENTAITKEVHTATNGKLTELVNTVKEIGATAKSDATTARAAAADIKDAVLKSTGGEQPPKEEL